jgi:hypothetical protein
VIGNRNAVPEFGQFFIHGNTTPMFACFVRDQSCRRYPLLHKNLGAAQKTNRARKNVQSPMKDRKENQWR